MATIIFLSAVLISGSITPEYPQNCEPAPAVILIIAFVWDFFEIVQKCKKK